VNKVFVGALVLVVVSAIGLNIDAGLGDARAARAREARELARSNETSIPAFIDAAATTTADPIASLTPDPAFRATRPAPYSWIPHAWIAHGMGGIDDNRVTNTLEAFQFNYERGYRVFEVDLVEATDGKLVARHDWEGYLYSFLGQKVDNPYGRLSTTEFKALKPHGKYTPLTIDDVVTIMRAYPDVWIMTDTKGTSKEAALKSMKDIKRAVGDDSVLAERFIVQIYNEDMLSTVRSVYPYRNIVYTLYQLQGTTDRALEFASSQNLRVVAVPIEKWTPELSAQARAAGLELGVYTTNDPKKAASLRSSGVSLIYSDFLPATK